MLFSVFRTTFSRGRIDTTIGMDGGGVRTVLVLGVESVRALGSVVSVLSVQV